MELFKIKFVVVRLVDIIDISMVSLLFYQMYKILRGSLTFRVLLGIFTFFVMLRIVDIFELVLLKSILNQLLDLGAIALVVLFAPEIRRFLQEISKNTIIDRLLRQLNSSNDNVSSYSGLIQAIYSLRSKGDGALIVLVGNTPLSEIAMTGDLLNAQIHSQLILTIFMKTSPLHDGAMLVHNNKVEAVRCILPITEQSDLPPELGLRHRAAIGVSEVSDALAIAVSEERQEVSIALGGQLLRDLDEGELREEIENFLKNLND